LAQPPAQVWDEVLEALRHRLGEGRFNLWLAATRPVENGEDGHYTLAVPSQFIRQWIQDRFLAEIVGAFADVEGERREIQLVVEEQPEVEAAAVETPRRVAKSPPVLVRPPVDEGSPLHERFTMDRFVPGRCNLIAHRSAQEVIESPGELYSPLYIYGETGLGKTHLLQGIAHGLQRRGRRVVHTSCEHFINRFVYAVSTKNSQSLRSFRESTRAADALLLDDVHLLRNKKATQVEFLHFYDTLSTLGKQIVLTADAPPQMIKRLKRELVTRFMSGMVARLEVPDRTTRLEILERRATDMRVMVTAPVLALLADVPITSVRELEGLLVRVAAYASLHGTPLDVAQAREALADVVGAAPPMVTLGGVEQAVVEYFHITPEELRARTRRRSHTLPRQIGMYLARVLTGCSLQEIGTHFGKKNHATVLYAERKITAARQQDPMINEVCETIIGRFQRPSGGGTC
jgi:chromosomal replication initiator protein